MDNIRWNEFTRPQGRFHCTFNRIGDKRLRVCVRDSRQHNVATADCYQHEVSQTRQALLDMAMLRHGLLPPKQP